MFSVPTTRYLQSVGDSPDLSGLSVNPSSVTTEEIGRVPSTPGFGGGGRAPGGSGQGHSGAHGGHGTAKGMTGVTRKGKKTGVAPPTKEELKAWERTATYEFQRAEGLAKQAVKRTGIRITKRHHNGGTQTIDVEEGGGGCSIL